MSLRSGIIARYGSRLRIDATHPVTLGEGDTPLIHAPRLAQWIGVDIDLYLKFEGLNPTGSFKDRGMVTAIAQALADGAHTVVCASTGNTSASAAAYAARAGLRCLVIIPDGKIASGKLAAAIAYGAQVVAIPESFDAALRMVRDLTTDATGVELVNSVNPARLEGQKTGAWEVADQLGRAPDWLTLPVGNAGNISAYWMGFTELSGARPRLLGTQASGAAPLLRGHPVDRPETRATAIRIGHPARGEQALAAIRESGGHLTECDDDAIFDAYRAVARLEGVFCEPSSAAGLAGLKRAIAEGHVAAAGQSVVAVLTGHGLKDPESALPDNWNPIRLQSPDDLRGLLQ